MKHVIFTSGGIASWYTGKLVAEKVGVANCIFLFNDTRSEDRDLYRFLVESVAALAGRDCRDLVQQCRSLPESIEEGFTTAVAAIQAAAAIALPELVWLADGRNLWQLFDAARFIGNTRVDVCSKMLKRQQGDRWLRANCDPLETTLYFGIDHSEKDRFYGTDKKPGIRKRLLPFQAEAPLCEPPYLSKCDLLKAAEMDGLDPPRLYDEGFAHNNCFSGDTHFLTDEGAKSLVEMVGKDCNVMGANGQWTPASVQSFGKQKVSRVTLKRYGHTKIIKATAQHRWFCYASERGEGRYETTTERLKPGDKLVFTASSTLQSQTRPSAFGVAHGVTFGDGTRNDVEKAGYTNPARLTLCTEAKRELLKYFPLSPSAEVEVGIEVRDLPRYFKDRPSLKESKAYLYGWLMGYFATDGYMSEDGDATISSANKVNLDVVRDVCVRLGLETTPIRPAMRSGFGAEPSELHLVTIAKRSIRDDFFIREDQRKRYVESGTTERPRRRAGWTVESIEPDVSEEEVYCAVVPDGHAFVLEDNILTGNCGGFCVKSGHAQFLQLLKQRPAVFAYNARKEQEFRERIGKDVAVMRDRSGGVSRPLPMLEFQRQVESGERVVNPRDWGKGCQCMTPEEEDASDSDVILLSDVLVDDGSSSCSPLV